MSIERMKSQGRHDVDNIRVTVRFADYDDYNLAKEIETTLKNCTDWPVELDGSNRPIIEPSDCKVVFAFTPWIDFSEVIWAFSYGKLIDGTIGRNTDRIDDEDREHLIVTVAPTIRQLASCIRCDQK